MDSRLTLKIVVVLAFLGFAPAARAATLAPTTFDFGTQHVGTVGASKGFTVTAEAVGLTVTGTSFSGDDDFLVSSSTCGATLDADGTCVIRVRFAPQATGDRAGVLHVLTSEGESTAALSGAGDPLPAGPTGPQGPQGDKGDTGPRGLQGDKGDKGDKGDTGAQGLQGVKGDTGPQGLKGDTGAQGLQGVKGDTGPRGFQGIQGDTGPQGPKGDRGDTGPQGLTGDAGPQGPKGDRGAPCLATDPACKGPKGDTGARGAQGPPGRDAVIQCRVVKTKVQGTLRVVCAVQFSNAR